MNDLAAASPPLALSAGGLRRAFGEVRAVDGVDLEIARGSVYGLLGPDGAGKSTLIKLLATVLPADAGDALVFGHSVRHAPDSVTPRIGYMSQRFSMYPDLTVAENIDFFATIRGVGGRDRRMRAAALLEGMGLAEFSGRRARTLSGGMKQKLMLAATLMHEPDLLLLDEPTTGVDPVSRREFWRIIAGLQRAGKSVLVATPYMDEAERCTEVAFLEGGRIRRRGTPTQIKGLVGGTLFEVVAPSLRDVIAALGEAPGLRSAHIHGDVVRVLSSNPEPEVLRSLLVDRGVAVTVVRPRRIDMEAAFEYLAAGEAG